MEVKIYREIENQDLILNEDHVSEYNELAAELGIIPLEQANKKNIPGIYQPLNNAMQKQLQALCPKTADLENFTFCTIPLEVLKVVQLAKKNNMYDGFQVWYNDVDPDPVLIGYTWRNEDDKGKNYTWLRNRFLIARWGDCALELPELLEKGTANLKAQLVDKAKIVLDKANAVLNNPDSYVKAILADSPDRPRVDFMTTADNTIY